MSGKTRHSVAWCRLLPSVVAALALAPAIVILWAAPATAQAPGERDLRQQIERRFEVLPLRNGLALKPKTGPVRAIEIADGAIAIDGMLVTGGELRDRLGADADAVIRLSYLDAASRRALFGVRDTPSGRGPSHEAEPRHAPEPPAVLSRPEAPEAPEPPIPPSPPRTHHSDARIRVGGSITVEPDEVVRDSVVVIGGSAHVLGRVDGDVVAIGGTVELGPHAEVARDVTVVGGVLHREEGAQVSGKINEIAVGAFDFSRLQMRRTPFQPFWRRSGSWSGFALASTVTRLLVLTVLMALVLAIGHTQVERIGARAAAEPVKAGLIGLLGQLLFLPLLIITIVLLVVTIIGIPLLVLVPFALLALVIVLLVGFTAVCSEVGRRVAGRFGWTGAGRFATAFAGLVAVTLPILLARILGLAGGVLFPLAAGLAVIGFAIEYVAWTVGLGAVALLRFERKPPIIPADAPAAAQAS